MAGSFLCHQAPILVLAQDPRGVGGVQDDRAANTEGGRCCQPWAAPRGWWHASHRARSLPGTAQQPLDVRADLAVLERVVHLPVDADLLVPAQQLQHRTEALGCDKGVAGARALLPGIDGQQLQGILGGQVCSGVLWLQQLGRRWGFSNVLLKI